MTKWVYAFGDGKSEGDAGMKNLLGGKGANLAEMSNLGLPVPPGFSITTEVCTYYYANGHEYPADLKDQVANHKRLQVVDELSQADLVLSGQILRVDTAPVGFNAVSEASIYQQYMVVRAQLQDRHTDKVIWANVLNSIEQFPTVSSTVVTTSPEFLQQNLRSQDIANLPDIQVAQTQQAASSPLMMTKMAQNIYSAMSEGF